jgi:hypothetical protein
MTPDEDVRAMAARLSAVDWERHGHRTWSKAALLKEYFRRAAQWADTYECDTRVPFFDIAACIDPSVHVDPEIVDGVLAAVEPGGRNVARLAPFILRWAALRSTPAFTPPPSLEDPYEPLIRLFERDGGFHTENGEVNLEYKSVRLAGWRSRATDPPMASFADEALDAIDRAGSLAQFGYLVDPAD